MKRKLIRLILILTVLNSCISKSLKESNKHIFYLHGRIIEMQGKDAFSETFGKYEVRFFV